MVECRSGVGRVSVGFVFLRLQQPVFSVLNFQEALRNGNHRFIECYSGLGWCVVHRDVTPEAIEAIGRLASCVSLRP